MADVADRRSTCCVQCGTNISPPRTKFCSNACKVAGHRQANPDRAAMYRLREIEKRVHVRPKGCCVYCGKDSAPRSRQCAQCKIDRRRSNGRARYYLGRRPMTCIDCAAPITGGWQRRCGECKQAAKRAVVTTCKVRRKSRIRLATVERFDPIDVLERDGWRCYICGVGTPRHLRGTHAPNAPELEHKMPISKGGDHSMANTACACRACNIKKGALTVVD